MIRLVFRILVALLLVAVGSANASAQLAARPADEWIKMLDAPARVASLRVDEVIAKLRLAPGQVVADLGAGAGVFSLPLARAVGPAGKVYAVEIEQGLVDYIAEKARRQNVSNVRPSLGRFEDPALPAADVDLAFFHDVLHHVADRPLYLKNVAKYVKPGGRIAVIEPDAERGPHQNQPTLQVTRERLRGWMAEAGCALVEELPTFDNKWYVIYVKK